MMILLLVSIAVGYLMLVAVFCIPQSRIFKGLANSVPVLERDTEEEVIFGYPSSRLDVFSDGAILNATIHTNQEGPFRRAVACYQYIYRDLSRAEAFIAYFEPREPDGDMLYVRYWHGILVILKPLFLFFNYSDIRMFNQTGQLILMCLCLGALAKKKLLRFAPAVLMTYFFLMPFTLPLSIQYSPVFYTGFASLTVLVYFYDRLKDKGWILYLFLMTGIITAYMDLLTYPMFTLGIPLAGLLIMRGTAGHGIFADDLKEFIFSGISWGAGYAGMWAGKILISIPFYGLSPITDALSSVKKRSVSGASEEGISYMDALNANLFMYKNDIFKVLLLLYTAIMAGYIICSLVRKGGRHDIRGAILYVVTGLIPFVWFMVTTEHAQVHSFMTYKNLAVTVFAYCAMLAAIAGNRSDKVKLTEGNAG